MALLRTLMTRIPKYNWITWNVIIRPIKIISWAQWWQVLWWYRKNLSFCFCPEKEINSHETSSDPSKSHVIKCSVVFNSLKRKERDPSEAQITSIPDFTTLPLVPFPDAMLKATLHPAGLLAPFFKICFLTSCLPVTFWPFS